MLQQFIKIPSWSSRDVAKFDRTSSSMVHRIKKDEWFKTYKKQKVLKRSFKQHNTAIGRAWKLYKILTAEKESCLIMDDETYVKMILLLVKSLVLH